MSVRSILRFSQYAEAFEVAFGDDNWSALEPFFTEEAVYETIAEGPFAARHERRDAVLKAFRQSVDSFDRRFDRRRAEIGEGPEEREGAVWMRWRVTYQVAGAPDFVLEGEERAWFDGRKISRLEDRIVSDATRNNVLAFMAEHGSKLRPAPGAS